MQVIDSSIVNVALPDMMGNLGASLGEIAWVSTGYILASVIGIPLTGFLGDLLGRSGISVLGVVLPIGLYAMAFTLPVFLQSNVRMTAQQTGALIFAAAAWQLSRITGESGASDFFWPLILRGVGLGLMFVPLTTITLPGARAD